ncbi:MAG: dodecin family protein [Gammaproteobacteria bacterium]|nr:dodecin family protein [Gammaproteobacteria bacterium]MBU1723355.1 dodecin family protein [Gammaproteobacteria bacterium]MBU2004280.1 dodecin family protein [Gammaproteobacteria bacterium]
MTVAKTVELTSSSSNSFDDAVAEGIRRANKTLKNIKGAWIADHQVKVDNGEISEYLVRLKVTFVLDD